MTSDVSRLLTLRQSILKLDGAQPFKFELKNTITILTSLARVLVERGDVLEAHSLDLAKTVIRVTEGCVCLPSSNMAWWRHVEDSGKKEVVLVVFLERSQDEEVNRGNT